ncbi:hypothetical protein OROHE_018620 [Orobanche hederae]
MCIKLPSKTLNPKAKEWRPTPKQLQPPSPPPQPAVHAAAFNPTPSYYHPNPLPIYHNGFTEYNAYAQCQPFYNASFPAHEIIFCKATTAAGKSKFRVGKMSYMERKTEGPRVKSPKSPPVEHAIKGQGLKRTCPPRLRRSRRRSRVDKLPHPAPLALSPSPPPPAYRREWMPKNSAKAGCKFSVDGGTSCFPPPPPCTYRPRPSHSKDTTVMIKNIPNQLRRDFMLKFLDDYCKTYSLEYDFLYLPIDFSKEGNLGYAFVNFTTVYGALKFKKILQNFKWGIVHYEGRSFTSNKVCDVTWARIQGKKALIERFEKSSFACEKLDFLPVILDPPRNGSDPNPSPPVILGSLDRSTLRKV